MFDFKKFLREGGVEKYLLEAQFGNDIESRYQYIRPLMSRLPDSARTEAMIDGVCVLGMNDDVIDPHKTVEMLKDEPNLAIVPVEGMGHRTPFTEFIEIIEKIVPEEVE